MSTLREFIDSRRKEVLQQIAALKAELTELKLAEAALSTGVPTSRTNKTERADTKATIKDMIIQVLSSQPVGRDANEIIKLIHETFGESIQRSSLSPQLSRLKSEGRVESDGRVWSFVKEEGSDADTSEPSFMHHGGGEVRGPDFPIASPEGANPSTSTRFKLSVGTAEDDDIPF